MGQVQEFFPHLMTPAFEAEINRQANRMRARVSGDITVAHMVNAVVEVEALLPQLDPGFTILTDLSGLNSMELECAVHFSRIMDLCRARGVSRVVRVIPDPSKDIGLNILSIIHYGSGVQILTCLTLAEAERAFK